MEEASLLSLPEGMRVEQIQSTEQGLMIEVEASHPTSCCPLCTQPSDSIKTHYRRILRDAPCAGRQVQLSLNSIAVIRTAHRKSLPSGFRPLSSRGPG